MKVTQTSWQEDTGWRDVSVSNCGVDSKKAHLVLAFGSRDVLKPERFKEIKNHYPKARVVMASTAGEISGSSVQDDTISCTALEFEKAFIQISELSITDAFESERIGQELVRPLLKEGLAYILVLSDGLCVNGTALLKGMNSNLTKGVVVTGGLAGDGSRFVKTLVGVDAPPSSGKVVCIGFYGKFSIGYGSVGGWDAFGPVRRVTRAAGNVLYELDEQPALELYKKYLGTQAKDLPGSGLLFPLSIQVNGSQLVRTILSTDEQQNTLTFAGDIPEGCQVQLMKANFERLIEGAEEAAGNAKVLGRGGAELAILISCVGRKLVLGPRVDEEIEAVREMLGMKPILTGFYSYGELCPKMKEANCELHNQTMTITTLSEVG